MFFSTATMAVIVTKMEEEEENQEEEEEQRTAGVETELGEAPHRDNGAMNARPNIVRKSGIAFCRHFAGIYMPTRLHRMPTAFGT